MKISPPTIGDRSRHDGVLHCAHMWYVHMYEHFVGSLVVHAPSALLRI